MESCLHHLCLGYCKIHNTWLPWWCAPGLKCLLILKCYLANQKDITFEESWQTIDDEILNSTKKNIELNNTFNRIEVWWLIKFRIGSSWRRKDDIKPFWIYGRRAVDSMSSSVSVNPKCVTKEYSYLIKLRLLEDSVPINARTTKCATEKNRKD